MNLAQAATVSFTTPGLAIWQVPAQVTSLNVVVTGGAGGMGGGGSYGLSGPGGRGAQVTSRLAVTPSETLRLMVGGCGFTGTSAVRGLGGGYGGGGGGGHSRITGMQGEVVAGGGGGGGGGGGPGGFGRGFSGSPGDSGGIPDGGGSGGSGGVSGGNGIPGGVGIIGLNGDGGGGGGGGSGGGLGGGIPGGGGSGGEGGSSSGPAGVTTYTLATYNNTPRHGSITLSYYTLAYANNGGMGTVPAPTGHGSEVSVIAADSTLFTRPGYTLTGWSSQPNGKGATYKPGQSFAMPAQDLTLYAQWEPATTTNTASRP